ncbi:DUF4190 domain-containing protein [Micromonospora sp. CPCC 206061]|uniref:DUF4190 domain-containing protein n=1 Tax=Micromonospora sp. CPCC 206061 TaxID=3122410 RepID=UPI003FA5F14A
MTDPQVPDYGYAPPPRPGPPQYGPPQPGPRTNGLAIASLVLSLASISVCVSAPIGAVLGHIARRQIAERGESGDGMARAGIIIGWIVTALLGAVILLGCIGAMSDS